MRKWKLLVYRFEPIEGRIDYADMTPEQTKRYQMHKGYNVPMAESLSLNSPTMEKVRKALEELQKYLRLKQGLELEGGEKVTIFSQSPIIGVDVTKEFNGTIKVGSNVGNQFTLNQYRAIFQFAEVLKEENWL